MCLFACVLVASAWTCSAASLTITTFAGPPETGAGALDGTPDAARFNLYSFANAQLNNPGFGGVAVDGSGNVYVADTLNHTIRKISPLGSATPGFTTTLAGLAGSSGSTDGTGGVARFNQPCGIAVDSSGKIYVADSGNNTIRTITPQGVVSTYAGSASETVNYSTDGPVNQARFYNPHGLALDSSNNLYITDFKHTIRKITPGGIVSTLAGSAGHNGTAGGQGATARFSSPQGVAVDGSGFVYVADTDNHFIRKITPGGFVTTLAGISSAGYADGQGAVARFRYPQGIAVDTSGIVYVGDTQNCAIRAITPTGVVTTPAGMGSATAGQFQGNKDGKGQVARFRQPAGVAVGPSGLAYLADAGNGNIRTMTVTLIGSAGTIDELDVATLAGPNDNPGLTDDQGSKARFNLGTATALGMSSTSVGMAVDNSGNVYLADTGNLVVRKITPDGVASTWINTIKVSNTVVNVAGVAVDSAGNNTYVTAGNTIQKRATDGTVSLFAGSPANNPGNADGTGSGALFNGPQGLAVDSSNNIYVADTGSHTIRKITSGGIVTTLAGLAGQTGSQDGFGNEALFNSPGGVAVDSSGNIYVADTSNNTIRVIQMQTLGAYVSTPAGSPPPQLPGSGDGQGSAASFKKPEGVAVDSSGNVYVADTGNNTIRLMTLNATLDVGLVSTLAGVAGTTGSTDGSGSVARFDGPSGVALNPSGYLFIADTGNHTIRMGTGVILDAATIDRTADRANVLRQLDTSPQTAASWQWAITRIPSGSSAALSSTSIRNPTFMPDVDDVFVFRLFAYAASGSTSISSVQLSTNDPPKITSSDSATGVVGQAFVYQIVASNNPTGYGAASLPAWAFVNAGTGTITGTPTVAGSTKANISATNAIGTDSKDLTITISPAPPVITSSNTATGLVGQLFSYQIAATNNPTSFSATNLPIWASLDATTGAIAGRPTAAGRVDATISASNDGGTGTAQLRINIAPSAAGGIAWGAKNYIVPVSPASDPGDLGQLVGIAAGGRHTLALRLDGTVFAWGNNDYLQCNVPPVDAGLTVTAVAAGYSHSVALLSNQKVIAWGKNTLGQCSVPANLGDVTAIAAGAWHTVVLKSDGTVVAWGDDSHGQCSAMPPLLSGVIAVSAGYWHTVALKGDGTVVAWGDDSSGQRSVPADLSGVLAIAAGSWHTVAIKSDLTVVAWGDNTFSQCSPLPAGLSGVTAIAAGGAHTVVLKSDGTVLAWGSNSGGQSSVPAPLNPVAAIAAGDSHSVALLTAKMNGTVTLTLASLRQTYDGTPKPAAYTTIPAGIPVKLTYNNDLTNFTPPTDQGNYAVDALISSWSYVGDVKNTLNIAKDQTIAFPPLPLVTIGDPDLDPGATATSGLPVAYASSNQNAATIVNGKIHLVAVGTANITASQAGDTLWNAAPNVVQALTVRKRQTINFPPLPNRNFGDQPFTVGASATSGLPVTLSIVSGPATGIGNTPPMIVILTGPGTVSIKASQPGNTTWGPAPDVYQLFTVNKGQQTINFPPVPTGLSAPQEFDPGATATSGLAVSYVINDTSVAQIDPANGFIRVVGAGQTLITASQAGDKNWDPANDVAHTLVVGNSQTITFDALPDKTFGNAPFDVSATATSTLPVSFSIVSGPATIVGTNVITNGNVVTSTATISLTGVGVVTVKASQPGDTTTSPPWLPAPDVTQSFTVGQASQTITFVGPLADKFYGEPPFDVSASASSGLPVSFSILGPASIVGNTVTITGAGAVTVKANQAGDINWGPAPEVDQTFNVAPAAATITCHDDVFIFDGTPKAETVTTSPVANLAVSFTYDGSATAPTNVGVYAVVATIANPNYQGSGNGTLTITKGSATVTLGNLSQTYDGNPKPALVVTSPPGLHVDVTYNGSPVAPTNAGVYAVVATVNDPNAQGGTTGTLTIALGTPVITWNRPAPLAYGLPLSSTQLNATANVPGTFNYSPPAGTVLSPGNSQPLSVVFSPADAANYRPAIAIVPIDVFPGFPPVITSAPAASGNTSQPFSYQITATNSPASYNATPLPGGLSINTSTGAITGTPTAAGTTTVTLTASNAHGTGSAQLIITIVIVPPAITSPLTASAVQGQPFTYQITATGTAPITFAATGLPDGLSFAGDTISGVPASGGESAITLSAANAGATDSEALLLTVALASGSNTTQPIIVSPPATPAPVLAGQPVTLTAAANDPGGDTLLYTWNFGDGTTGYGSSATHVYTVAGIYTATLTVSDGVNSTSVSVSVPVNAAAPPSGTFKVAKAALQFNWKASAQGKDSLALSGFIPVQPQLNPWRKTVFVVIGDLQRTFMLTGAGLSGGDSGKTFKLSGKMSGASFAVTPAKFTLTLKNQSLFNQLKGLGFTNGDTPRPGQRIEMPVLISVDGVSYLDRVSVLYKAKAGKSGSAKK